MSEEAKPARKIKPPSASFLKSKEVTPSSEGLPVVASETPDDGTLGAPSIEAPADDDLFSVPAPETQPELEKPPPPDLPAPSASQPGAAPDPDRVEKLEKIGEPGSESTLAERLQAELRELRDIVHAVESLAYLRNRVARALDEGADALTLVSFYRLVARSLSEQTEQARRDFEQQRSKVGKLELELATAVATGAVGEPAAPTRQAATGISEEAEARIAKLELEVTQANEQREKLLLDFKNMRERTQKDLDIKLFREKEKFFGAFLPALDAFDQAQRTGAGATDVASVVKGYGMIYGMILEAMAGEGLEPVDTSGVFDPRYHEAVGEIDNNQKPDQHVFDELQRGYRLGERLIRPAMVRISRNPSGIIEPPPDAAES